MNAQGKQWFQNTGRYWFCIILMMASIIFLNKNVVNATHHLGCWHTPRTFIVDTDYETSAYNVNYL